MKKIIAFIFPSLLLINVVFSQNKCCTQVIASKMNNNQAVIQSRKKVATEMNSYIENTKNTNNYKKAAIKVPVVVHLLYTQDSENKTDLDIQSQITILNQDFNRTNPDANKTPAEFLGVAASIGIDFFLADIDPDGNPTTGIVRKKVTVPNIGDADSGKDAYGYDSLGGSSAWDESKYMNIWVCEIDGNGTLGYAYFPGDAKTYGVPDGLVISLGAFGTEKADFGTDLGRTVTHEVGHYFGLFHIWGDDQNETDVCSVDDQVADTPLQGVPTESECPASKNSCGSNDMFQNYMDYSTDDCMNIFTQGQKTRALAGLSTRPGLITGLKASSKEVSFEDLAQIYPIPATDYLTINLISAQVAKVELLDISGMLVFSQNYVNTGNSTIDVTNLTSGTYLLRIQTEGKIATTKVVVQ